MCVRVSDTIGVLSPKERRDNWKEAWASDLTHTIILWGRLPFTPYSFICHSYFGLYDSEVRKWVAKSVASNNRPPSFFPESLTTADGTAQSNRQYIACKPRIMLSVMFYSQGI